MRTGLATTILSSVVFVATGCAATNVTVSKVTQKNSPAGIRYSLPQPFLLVVPNAAGDGGFEAKVIYLPDEQQTYAIDAETQRGKYTLDVTIAEGLLSKIQWARADASVAAEAVRVSGEVTKAELERVQKEKDEQKTKAEDARKEARTKLETLQDTSREKELDVKLAQAEVKSAKAAVDAAPQTGRDQLIQTLQAAQLRLDQAQLRFEAAKNAVDSAQRKLNSLANAMNEPSSGATSPSAPAPGMFWGPVLYRIVDDPKSKTVKLVAIRWKKDKKLLAQLPLETTAVSKPPPPSPSVPTLTDTTPIKLSFPPGAEELLLTLTFDNPLSDVDDPQTLLFRILRGSQEVVEKAVKVDLDPNDKKIVRAKLRRVDPGSYEIQLRFTHGPNNTSGTVSVPLTISPP